MSFFRASQPNPTPRASLLAALAAIAGALVMLGALDGPFIFDDVSLILGNHYVHGLEHWRRWFQETLWSTNFDATIQHRSFFRPFVVASYALDWWWGGGRPIAFHCTNTLIHAVNGFLVFHLLRGWVGASWPALAGAVAFAVHPVQTEPAAWIAGRTDSLAALGLLGATLGIRIATERRVLGLCIQALSILLAFGSKEMAVVLPVLAGIEVWSERREPLSLGSAKRLLLSVSPYLAVSLVYVAAQRYLDPGQPLSHGVPWQSRLALMLEAYGRYAALLFWPDDLTLGRSQMRYVDGLVQPSSQFVIVGAFALLAAGTLAYRLRFARPELSLSLVAVVVTLLPVSSVIWLGRAVLVAPRFLYVPMIAAAYGLAALLHGRLGTLRWTSLATAALLALLGARCALRAQDFASAEAFWGRELSENPGYAPAHEYFVSREIQAGRPHAAIDLARRGLELEANAQGPEGEQRAMLLLKLIGALLAATPDIDQDTLGRVELFTRAAVAGATYHLSVPKAGVDIDLSKENRSRAALQREEKTLRMMTAEAAQRRGDDRTARAELGRALDGCFDCWTLLSNGSLILARAGQLDEALALADRAQTLSSPGQLDGLVDMIRGASFWQAQRADGSPIAEAAFHASLGSFGRAYAAARPALVSPPTEPGAVLSLAQLAFQAGDIMTSRRLLMSIFPEEAVQRSLGEFGSRVPWRDRPRELDASVTPESG